MKLSANQIFSLSLVSMITFSCSKDDGQQRDSVGGKSLTSGEIIADSELSGEAVNTQIVEAVNAVASDNNDSSSAGLSLDKAEQQPGNRRGLPPMPKGGDRSFDAVCVENDDGTAKVTIDRSFSHEFTRENTNFSFSESVSNSFQASRVWSQGDSKIECNEAGKRIKMPEDDVVGLKLVEEVSDSFKREGVRTVKSTSEEKKLSISREGSVKRSFEITDVVVEDGQEKISKTITKDASRKVSILKDDEVKEMSMAIKTDDENPMKVIITRDAESKEWIQREIVSGTDIGSLKSGLILETTYENVIFTSQKKCSAISGKVSGVVKDGENVVQSFEITFSEDGASKVVEGESGEEEINIEGCDLDL